MLDHLRNSDTDFHTFCPPSSRPFRIVIRNLHQSTHSSDISDAITKFGYSVIHTENIKKNKLSLPLFFVDLNPSINNSDNSKLLGCCISQSWSKNHINPKSVHLNVINVKLTVTRKHIVHKNLAASNEEKNISPTNVPKIIFYRLNAHSAQVLRIKDAQSTTNTPLLSKNNKKSEDFQPPFLGLLNPWQSENPCNSNQTRTYADDTTNQPPAELSVNLNKRI
jgi:hypothetical protein